MQSQKLGQMAQEQKEGCGYGQSLRNKSVN